MKDYSVIADVLNDGTIILDGGEPVFLRDIRFPSMMDDAQSLRFLRNLEGSYIMIRAKTEKNRWGKQFAVIELVDEKEPAAKNLAELLVEKGLVFVDAGENKSLCSPNLLHMETFARRKKKGLWADTKNRPVPAFQVKTLLDRKGQFTLVEGKVLSIGQRARRTYLNFGRNWKQDFTIIIPHVKDADVQVAGMPVIQLQGKKVCARGVVDEWNGPFMTLYAHDTLELCE